jgi:hypothetical protein
MQHGDSDLALKDKDEEIEVYKSGMEQALMELEELRLVGFDCRNRIMKLTVS